jgi:recombination associated protein RdgC
MSSPAHFTKRTRSYDPLMFFRNLTLFRFTPSLDLSQLEAALQDFRLKPVGPLEMSTRGFVSPFGRDEEVLTHRIGSGIWITIGGEDKILPSAVVNDITSRKAAEIEEREGRRLGGRARKKLKEEVLHDLLPRAFVCPMHTNAHIDVELGFIAVDSSSRKTAELVLTELRQALGSFPALPLNAELDARGVLTGWLAGEPLPDGMALGDECELKDPVDRGAVVRCTRQELECDEIGKHLEAGKQCSKLAVTLDDHLGFVFGDDLVVRKLKFLDGAVESLENTERDSLRAELDARYALMVAELKRLFVVLEGAFKLSKVE